MNQRFYFATCQVGAGKAVKAEVAEEFPQLRFAFSKPGFITFRQDAGDETPLVLRRSIFTRLWGEVVGQCRDTSALPDLIAFVPANAAVQCFDRDEYMPGEEPPSFARNGKIRSAMAMHGLQGYAGVPVIGEPVYSFVWVDDSAVFLCRHVHARFLVPAPGNIPDIRLPLHAPSRAFLKIEEAFMRFEPSLETGLHVLEIGCAPGGATTAMLDRGLRVTGIDPQHMAAGIYARAGFNGIRKAARFVVDEDLVDTNPDVIVMDMSIPPLEAIPELAHVIKLLRNLNGGTLRLRRGFFTLKLNSWGLVSDIPVYLEKLARLGFIELHPIQLCSNRQEFFVYAGGFVS